MIGDWIHSLAVAPCDRMYVRFVLCKGLGATPYSHAHRSPVIEVSKHIPALLSFLKAKVGTDCLPALFDRHMHPTPHARTCYKFVSCSRKEWPGFSVS